MAKATQLRDIVPTRVAALSASYFDGVPSRATLEDIEDRVLCGFGRYATLNADSKTAAREKRELKEKMTPWLRALRTQLNTKGRKGEGWQRWCDGHKAAIGGISRKTADRWIDGNEDKKKYANLDSANGLKLNGKEYSFRLAVENDRVTGIKTDPEVATETAKSVAPKKLDASSTRVAVNKFFWAYKRKHKDNGSSQWEETYFAALTAEYGKHPEWRKGTADKAFQDVRVAIFSRQGVEEDRRGWTRVDKKHWKHEDGRSITKTSDRYMTFDKDGLSIHDNKFLDWAMGEKRQVAASLDTEKRAEQIPQNEEAL